MGDGGQHGDQRVDRRCYRQGYPVGVLEGIGFGNDLAEDDDEKRHGEGSVYDAGLAKAIVSLARDPDLRKKLSANALSYLQTQHWRHREHEYLELVDRLLSESRSS